jgi:hypothetical protein
MPAGSRTPWRGVTITERMRDAVRYAERLVQKTHPGVTLLPAQGSWSNGSLSAGTHTGAGAIDVRTVMLTDTQRRAVVRALKRAGLVAWFRPYNWDGRGGGQHVHVLDKDTTGMAAGARAQVVAYQNGRNGLRSNRPDPTLRVPVKWDYRKGKPVPE